MLSTWRFTGISPRMSDKKTLASEKRRWNPLEHDWTRLGTGEAASCPSSVCVFFADYSRIRNRGSCYSSWKCADNPRGCLAVSQDKSLTFKRLGMFRVSGARPCSSVEPCIYFTQLSDIVELNSKTYLGGKKAHEITLI